MSQYVANAGNRSYDIRMDEDGIFYLAGQPVEVMEGMGSGFVRLKINHHHVTAYCQALAENEYEIWIKHYTIYVKLEDERSLLLRKFGRTAETYSRILTVKAPMPGLVIGVSVQAGETVEIGKGLMILEAMKMENEIRSTAHGKVIHLYVEKGAPVEKGQTLLTMEQK